MIEYTVPHFSPNIRVAFGNEFLIDCKISRRTHTHTHVSRKYRSNKVLRVLDMKKSIEVKKIHIFSRIPQAFRCHKLRLDYQ